MGAGTRLNQVKSRFGLGQPIDTYGEPCPHAKPTTHTNSKETVDALSYKDIIDAQASIFWKQAIDEAVQDGNLRALAGAADDLGVLRSYYTNGELSLVLKGTTREGKTIRVTLLPNLTEAIMAEEGPVQVKLINPATGEAYGFYKDLHNVKYLDIHTPKEMMNNFQADREVIVKMKQLPTWEFVNQIKGKASKLMKFKEIKFKGNPSVPQRR